MSLLPRGLLPPPGGLYPAIPCHTIPYHTIPYPTQLFTNTKADLGACPKIHKDHLRDEFQKVSEENPKKLEYMEDLLKIAQRLCGDLQSKIRWPKWLFTSSLEEKTLSADFFGTIDLLGCQVNLSPGITWPPDHLVTCSPVVPRRAKERLALTTELQQGSNGLSPLEQVLMVSWCATMVCCLIAMVWRGMLTTTPLQEEIEKKVQILTEKVNELVAQAEEAGTQGDIEEAQVPPPTCYLSRVTCNLPPAPATCHFSPATCHLQSSQGLLKLCDQLKEEREEMKSQIGASTPLLPSTPAPATCSISHPTLWSHPQA